MNKYKKKAGIEELMKDRRVNMAMPELKEDKVIHFGAVWNSASRELVGVLDQIAKDKKFKGKVDFHEVDVDEHLDVCAKFGYRDCPVVMIVKGGKVVKEIKKIPYKNLGEVMFKNISQVFK